MKKLKNPSSILFALTLGLMAGCGSGHGGKNPPSMQYSTSAQLQAVRNLTTEERNIATRICYAYQSKSTNFKTPDYMGATFNFNISSRDCTDKVDSYIVNSILATDSNNRLTFQSSTTKPFRPIVQTTEVGYLVQLCSKIQNNLAISNTVSISDSERVQITLFRDSMDAFRIDRFTPNSENKFVISSSETFKIRTQNNLSSGQIVGMDEVFVKQETCSSNPKKYVEFSQTFSNFKSNNSK